MYDEEKDIEIKEEANLFMKGVYAIVLIIVIALALCLSSCVRYKTFTKHTRDTTYIYVEDTTKGKLKDSLAPEKADAVVDTAFKEIVKDCPNLEKKLPALKKQIQDAETIESKTGGSISSHSDSLGVGVVFEFDGDKIKKVTWKGTREIIEDKTETTITKKPSTLMKALSLWYWFLIVAFIFWVIGRFMR